MAEIVVNPQGDRSQRNGPTGRIDPAAGNICASFHEYRVVKQVIRSAVLLEDDHDVLEFPCENFIVFRITATAVHGQQKDPCCDYHRQEKKEMRTTDSLPRIENTTAT